MALRRTDRRIEIGEPGIPAFMRVLTVTLSANATTALLREPSVGRAAPERPVEGIQFAGPNVAYGSIAPNRQHVWFAAKQTSRARSPASSAGKPSFHRSQDVALGAAVNANPSCSCSI